MLKAKSLQAPLRWGRRFAFGLLLLAGASQAQPPVFATPGLGFAVIQNGIALPIADFGAHFQVNLTAAPFQIRTDDLPGEGVFLALGLTAAVFDRFGSAADPLFGPASAYAREEKAGVLYLTDPACRGPGPAGFNILWDDQRVAGVWPVERIEPDRSSDTCATPAVPPRETLIRPGRTLYLVVSDGEGADFVVLVWDAVSS